MAAAAAAAAGRHPEESARLSGSSRGLAPGHSQASSATSIGKPHQSDQRHGETAARTEPSIRPNPQRSDIYKQFYVDRKADILRTASSKTMASYVDNSFRQAVMMNPAERTQQVGMKKTKQKNSNSKLIACILLLTMAAASGRRLSPAFLFICVSPPYTQPASDPASAVQHVSGLFPCATVAIHAKPLLISTDNRGYLT